MVIYNTGLHYHKPQQGQFSKHALCLNFSLNMLHALEFFYKLLAYLVRLTVLQVLGYIHSFWK